MIYGGDISLDVNGVKKKEEARSYQRENPPDD